MNIHKINGILTLNFHDTLATYTIMLITIASQFDLYVDENHTVSQLIKLNPNRVYSFTTISFESRDTSVIKLNKIQINMATAILIILFASRNGVYSIGKI